MQLVRSGRKYVHARSRVLQVRGYALQWSKRVRFWDWTTWMHFTSCALTAQSFLNPSAHFNLVVLCMGLRRRLVAKRSFHPMTFHRVGAHSRAEAKHIHSGHCEAAGARVVSECETMDMLRPRAAVAPTRGVAPAADVRGDEHLDAVRDVETRWRKSQGHGRRQGRDGGIVDVAEDVSAHASLDLHPWLPRQPEAAAKRRGQTGVCRRSL